MQTPLPERASLPAYKNLINSFFRGTGSGTSDDPFLPQMNHATLALAGGNLLVASPGFAVPLKSVSTPAKWVMVQAYRGNVDNVAIGGSGVNASATLGTGTGVVLAPGDSMMIPVADLNSVYADAVHANDGVRFVYGT